jgi:hypothetical protein
MQGANYLFVFLKKKLSNLEKIKKGAPSVMLAA